MFKKKKKIPNHNFPLPQQPPPPPSSRTAPSSLSPSAAAQHPPLSPHGQIPTAHPPQSLPAKTPLRSLPVNARSPPTHPARRRTGSGTLGPAKALSLEVAARRGLFVVARGSVEFAYRARLVVHRRHGREEAGLRDGGEDATASAKHIGHQPPHLHRQAARESACPSVAEQRTHPGCTLWAVRFDQGNGPGDRQLEPIQVEMAVAFSLCDISFAAIFQAVWTCILLQLHVKIDLHTLN